MTEKEVFTELKESAPEISRLDFFTGCALIALGSSWHGTSESVVENAVHIAKVVISKLKKSDKK